MKKTTIQTFKSQYVFDQSDVVALKDGPTGPVHIGILSTEDYDRTYLTTTSGSFDKTFLPAGDDIETAISNNFVSGATSIADDYLLNVTVTDAKLNIGVDINKPLTINSATLQYDAIPVPQLTQTTKFWCTTQTQLMFQNAKLNLPLKVYFKKLPMICGMQFKMSAQYSAPIFPEYLDNQYITVLDPGSGVGDTALARSSSVPTPAGGYTSPYKVRLSIQERIDSRDGDSTFQLLYGSGDNPQRYKCNTFYFVKNVFDELNKSILGVQNTTGNSEIPTNTQYYLIENSIPTKSTYDMTAKDYSSGVCIGNTKILDLCCIFDTIVCGSYLTSDGISYSDRPLRLAQFTQLEVTGKFYTEPKTTFAGEWPFFAGGHVISCNMRSLDRVSRIYFTNTYDYWTRNFSVTLKNPNANLIPCKIYPDPVPLKDNSGVSIFSLPEPRGDYLYISRLSTTDDEAARHYMNFSGVSSVQHVEVFSNSSSTQPPLSASRIYQPSEEILTKDLGLSICTTIFTKTQYIDPSFPGLKYTSYIDNSPPYSNYLYDGKTFATLNYYGMAQAAATSGFSTISGSGGQDISTSYSYDITALVNAKINRTQQTFQLYDPNAAANSKIYEKTQNIQLWPDTNSVGFLYGNPVETQILTDCKTNLRQFRGADYIGFGNATLTLKFTYEPTSGTTGVTATFPITSNISIDSTYNNRETTLPQYLPYDITSEMQSLVSSGPTGKYLSVTDSAFPTGGSDIYLIDNSNNTTVLPINKIGKRRAVTGTNTPKFNISGYYDWSGVSGASTIPGLPTNLRELLGGATAGVTFGVGSAQLIKSNFDLAGSADDRNLSISLSIFTPYIDTYLQSLYFPSFNIGAAVNTIPELGITVTGENIETSTATLSIYYSYGGVVLPPYRLSFNGLTTIPPIKIEEKAKDKGIVTIPLNQTVLDTITPSLFLGLSSEYFSSKYNGYTGTNGILGDGNTPNMSSLGILRSTFLGFSNPDWNNSSLFVQYNIGNSLTRNINYITFPLSPGNVAKLQSTRTETIRYYTKEQREIIIRNEQYNGTLYIVNVRSNKAGYTFTQSSVSVPVYNNLATPYYKFCKLPRNGIEIGDDISALVDLNNLTRNTNITFQSYSDEFNNFDSGPMKTLKEITSRLGYVDSRNNIITQIAQINVPATKGFLNEFFVLNNVLTEAGTTANTLYLFATCTGVQPEALSQDITGLVVYDGGNFVTGQPISTNGFSSELVNFNLDTMSGSIFDYNDSPLSIYSSWTSSRPCTMRVINNTIASKYDSSVDFQLNRYGPLTGVTFYGLLPNTTYYDTFLTYKNETEKNHTQIRNFSFTTGVTGFKFFADQTCVQLENNDRGYELNISNIKLTSYPSNVTTSLSDESSPYELVVDMKSDAQIYSITDFSLSFSTFGSNTYYKVMPIKTRIDTNGLAIVPIQPSIKLHFYNLIRGRTYSPVMYLRLKSDSRFITNTQYLNQIIIPAKLPITLERDNKSWCIGGKLKNFDLYESTVFEDRSVIAGTTGMLTIYTDSSSKPEFPPQNTYINAQIPIYPNFDPTASSVQDISFTAVNMSLNNLNWVVGRKVHTIKFSFSHGLSGSAGTEGTCDSNLGGKILTTGDGTINNLNNELVTKIVQPYLNGNFPEIPEFFAGTVSVEPHQYKTVITIKDFNYYQIHPDYMFSNFYGGTLTVYCDGDEIAAGSTYIMGSTIIQPGTGVQDVQIILDKATLLQNSTYNMVIVYSCNRFGTPFEGKETIPLSFTTPSGIPGYINDVSSTALMHKIVLTIPVGSNNYLDTLSFDIMQPTLFFSVAAEAYANGLGPYNGTNFPWTQQSYSYYNGRRALKLDGNEGRFLATQDIPETAGEPKYGFGWREVTGNDAIGDPVYAPYIPGVGYRVVIDNLLSDSNYKINIKANDKNTDFTLIDYDYPIYIRTLPDQVSANSVIGITGTTNYLLDQFYVKGSTSSYLTSGNVYFGPTGSSAAYVSDGVTSSDSTSYFQFQPQVSIYTGVFDLSLPFTFADGIPSATSVNVFNTVFDRVYIGITGLAYAINGINSVNTNDSLVIIGDGINQVVGLTGMSPDLNLSFTLKGLQEATTYSGVTGYYKVGGSLQHSDIGIPIPSFSTPTALDPNLGINIGIKKIKLVLDSGTKFNGNQISSLFAPGNTGQSFDISLYSTTTPDETDFANLNSLYGSTGPIPTSIVLTGIDPLIVYDRMKINYTFLNSESELQTLNLDLLI